MASLVATGAVSASEHILEVGGNAPVVQSSIAKITAVICGALTVLGVSLLVVAGTGHLDFSESTYAFAGVGSAVSAVATYYSKKMVTLVSLAFQVDRFRNAIDNDFAPEVDRLQKANDEAAQLLQTFKDQIETVSRTFAASAEQFSRDGQVLVAVTGDLQSLETDLTTKIAAIGEGIENYRRQNAERQVQIDRLAQENQSLDVTREALQKSVAALSQGQAVSTALQRDQEKLVRDEKVLQKRREELQAQQENLIREQAAGVAELSQIQTEYLRSQHELQGLVDKLNAVKGEMVAIQLKKIGVTQDSFADAMRRTIIEKRRLAAAAAESKA